MPELAEVEYYRRTWEPGIGLPVRQVEIHPKARIFREKPPRNFSSLLVGQPFVVALRHGKQLLFGFDERTWLNIHLGMSGRLYKAEADVPVGKHDHLVLRFGDLALVFNDPRMFGKATLHEGQDDGSPPEWWWALPPEPDRPTFTRAHLAGELERRRRSPLKALLLDQQIFPGIGNWMADEILWRSALHPARTAASLDGGERNALWKRTRQVCRDALRVIAPDWGTPPESWLFPHRWKDGGHCPTKGCGRKLQRATIGGRTTCWCPECQPES